MQIAVSKTVAEFNMGYEKTLQLETELTREQLRLDARLKIARARDESSITRSVRRVSEESRYKRKATKIAKGAEERAKRRKEGPSYGAGIAN